MTQGVVTAEGSDSLRAVGELMRDRNVGSVVVCDGGRPIGVITDRDLALAVAADGVGCRRRQADSGVAPARDRRRRDGASRRPWRSWSQHRIRRLPVLRSGGAGRHRHDRRPRGARRRPPRRAPDHRRGGAGRAARVLLPPARRLNGSDHPRTASPPRARWRALIRLAAPGLNLVLAAGERLSQLVEPEDTEYYPPRVSRGGAAAPGRPALSGPETDSTGGARSPARMGAADRAA